MSDLCELQDVKTYLGSTSNASDSAISPLITACSAAIEQYCNRTFAQASYTETRNGRNTHTLYMRQQPIVSVQSLTIDDVTIQPSPDTQTYGYVFDDQQIYLRGTSPCYGPYGQPDRFTRGIQNITASYTAGYATTPIDVAQACVEWVCWAFAKRNRIDESSQTLGTQQTQAYSMLDMPPQVRLKINNYRVPMVPA